MNKGIDLKKCTEKELWQYVGGHLTKNGVDAVLVGGAVVSIYSKGAYRSGDLDFIIRNLFIKDLPEIMGKIGFKKRDRHYVHPNCKHLFIEFPKGPLGIGNETKIEPSVQKRRGVEFKILTPTDCIKDRLASYIHFRTRDTLEQAILVANAQPFKAAEIKQWCENEGAEWAFKEFKSKIAKPKIKNKSKKRKG